jgi:hypothetical protein
MDKLKLKASKFLILSITQSLLKPFLKHKKKDDQIVKKQMKNSL